jgi:hypothetical protein
LYWLSFDSLDHLCNLRFDFLKSGSKGHVHELSFGVHLKSSFNGLVNGELKGEFFSCVQWVGFECVKNLVLLSAGESIGRDDGDLLLLVQSFVELDVSVGDASDISKSLIFSQDFQELDGQWMESSNALESSVELSHLSLTNSCVLGELLE